VQNVVRSPLAAAKRTLAAAGCSTGKLKRVYSKRIPKGAVISQRPAFGAVLPRSHRVELVFSLGRKKR
jgi:beta-lactam-binding protein with PASTA domain